MGIFCWERRHVYERWPPSKRKGRSSVLREPASIDGQWNRLQLFKLVSQGGYTEKPNTRGIDKDVDVRIYDALNLFDCHILSLALLEDIIIYNIYHIWTYMLYFF